MDTPPPDGRHLSLLVLAVVLATKPLLLVGLTRQLDELAGGSGWAVAGSESAVSTVADPAATGGSTPRTPGPGAKGVLAVFVLWMIMIAAGALFGLAAAAAQRPFLRPAPAGWMARSVSTAARTALLGFVALVGVTVALRVAGASLSIWPGVFIILATLAIGEAAALFWVQ